MRPVVAVLFACLLWLVACSAGESDAARCERVGYHVVFISHAVQDPEVRSEYRDSYLAEQGISSEEFGECLKEYPFTMVLAETQAEWNHRVYQSTFP